MYLTLNRESGFGRYDVVLEPRRWEDDAIILEFKVLDTEDEKELFDTVKRSFKADSETELCSVPYSEGNF